MIKKFQNGVMEFISKGMSPTEIAFGIALGNFVGILPFLGLHTVIAFGLAYIFRLNMVIVFLGTQISNPLSFPLILFASAQIGSIVVHGSFLNISLTSNIEILKNYILLTTLGSILLGLTVSIPSYFLTLVFARRLRQ